VVIRWRPSSSRYQRRNEPSNAIEFVDAVRSAEPFLIPRMKFSALEPPKRLLCQT
jgi:hypothetical protein